MRRRIWRRQRRILRLDKINTNTDSSRPVLGRRKRRQVSEVMKIDCEKEKSIRRIKSRSFSAGEFSAAELAESAQSHLLEAFGYLILLKSAHDGNDCDPYGAEDALILTDDAIIQINCFIQSMKEARERHRNDICSKDD